MKKLNFKIQLVDYITSLYTALFFITPLLMYSKTSEIFEFNKMMFIYLTSIVIGFFYLLHIMYCRERFYKHLFYIPLLLFAVSQFFSTIFSIDIHTSLFGYYGRWNGGLISILVYISLFVICIQVFTYDKLIKLLKVSLFSSCIVILWGIPGLFGMDLSCWVFTGEYANTCWTQEFNPAVRMFSTIGQPNWLGAYLVIHFFIALFFLIRSLNNNFNVSHLLTSFRNPRIVLITLYLLLNMLALYFTKSRSSWLALLISFLLGSILYVFYFDKVSKNVLKKSLLTLGIVLVLLFGLTIKQGWIRSSVELPTEAVAVSESADIRKVVWKGALDLGNRYPFFGSGVETFAYAYYLTRPWQHNLTSEWDFIYNKAHNEYLNYLATTGYIGLFAYLGMIAGTFVIAYSSLHKESLTENKNNTLLIIALTSVYTGILITNFFGFSVSEIQLFFYLIPAFLIVLYTKEQNHSLFSVSKVFAASIGARLYTLVLAILFLAGIIQIQRYYLADMNYALGRAALESDQNQKAVSYLSQALNLKYEHVYEDKLSSALANYAFEQALQKNQGYAVSLINLSQKANLHTLTLSPYNILYWRTQGKNYYVYYQITQNKNDLYHAAQAMEKMVEIAPTDVQSTYTLALFYWIVSNEITDKKNAAEYASKAKVTLQEALEMKPNYIEAQELLNTM